MSRAADLAFVLFISLLIFGCVAVAFILINKTIDGGIFPQ